MFANGTTPQESNYSVAVSQGLNLGGVYILSDFEFELILLA